MRTNASHDLTQVLVEAQDMAQAADQPCSSTHVLLALFTVPNRAQVLLRDRGLSEDGILERIERVEHESQEMLDTLINRARTLASQANMREVECLHLLVAVLRSREVTAFRLLQGTGIDLVAIRNQAMSYLTGNMPRRVREATFVRDTARKTASSTRRILDTALPPTRQPQPGASPRSTLESKETAGPEESEEIIERTNEPTRPTSKPDEGETADKREPLPTKAHHVSPMPWYRLDPEEYPWLAGMGRNLTELAFEGGFDPLIGREHEIEEIIDVLGKRKANNPVLVGEPGVGKTAIVEGLAQRLLALRQRGHKLGDRLVIELDMASILAGTHLRGSFSEKLGGIKDEVRKARGRIIVFIDEMHTMIGAGATGEGPQDAANELKASLARGEFPCVGATTHDEYRKFIEQDLALERRFSPVLVAEPGIPETCCILEGLVERYSEHHEVEYLPEALQAAVSLSERYITDRCLPDKAIGIIDLAGSRASREDRDIIDAADIARVISKLASVPEERLLMTDRERFLNMEDKLAERIVGHHHAVQAIARTVRRNYAGFDSRRPMGSFLLMGPTGVGKTETAKALAKILFESGDALIRLDMSEFGESNTSARLIGAPPGYVGYGDGGQLTEAVRRRPFAVVLLDEIEKAHREVLQLLLQILDEGHLTDGRGRQVTFANTVIIMTTNLGSEAFEGGSRSPMGFTTGGNNSDSAHLDPMASDDRVERVIDVARDALSPELWNRIEERLVFQPLTRDQVAEIAELLLEDSSRTLTSEKRISYRASKDVIEHLIDNGGFDPSLGARPLRQTLQRLIEAPIAERILSGELVAGDSIALRLSNDKIVFEKAGGGSANGER